MRIITAMLVTGFMSLAFSVPMADAICKVKAKIKNGNVEVSGKGCNTGDSAEFDGLAPAIVDAKGKFKSVGPLTSCQLQGSVGGVAVGIPVAKCPPKGPPAPVPQTGQTTLSAPEFVFGPEVFVRGQDKSEEIREFPIAGFVGPFILHADNGPAEDTDGLPPTVRFGAKISLNGKRVLRDRDFSNTGSTNRIEVDLEDPSTLVVKLHGRPGNVLTIWIEGTKGAEVDPGGATVTDPEGDWELVFPASALASPTEITVKPAIDFPDDPNLVPRTAFEFGPDGTQFTVPVQLTIAYDPNHLPAGVVESDLKLHKRVGGSWVEVAGSSVDEANDTVTGSINSFSTLAVLGLAGGKLIFQGTFTADAVDGPVGSPEIGTWTLINELAGTIRVRSAVGDLTDNPVELVQTAGIAGGVSLGGTVAGTPPTTGVFVVRWRSLVSSSDTSVALIVLRGGIPGRPPLASLSYVSPGNLLQYNTTTLTETWAVGISQLFEITVDLDAKVTSLSIDGVPSIQNEPFFLPADDLERISIEMGGTQSQTLAWDNIEIQRKSLRKILIYGPTMNAPTVNSPQNEQTLAQAAGFTVTVADATTWGSLTTADFEMFDAIVVGDQDGCPSSTFSYNPLFNNRATWSPAVTGPIIVIGGNPQHHQSNNTGDKLAQILKMITNGIKFAASGGVTGLYLSLGCPLSTTSGVGLIRELLRAIPGEPCSTSCVFGVNRFSNDVVSITDLAHPAMQGLTDAGLSGWGRSVHGSIDSFPGLNSNPGTFTVVADSVGRPYIIARSP